MMQNIAAAVLAGGQGTRMGKDLPKQFLPIGGRPVLVHTLEAFLACSEIDPVLVVTPAEWISYTQELLAQAFASEPRLVVIQGGSDRSESLMQAIRWLSENEQLQEETILVSHDAVRPFVTPEVIAENIRVAKLEGAVMTVVPATDTIISSEDGHWISTVPDRRKMFQMQTPQTFHAAGFARCYQSLDDEARKRVTDASGVLMACGIPVAMVEGLKENLKITYPEDLHYANWRLDREREGIKGC